MLSISKMFLSPGPCHGADSHALLPHTGQTCEHWHSCLCRSPKPSHSNGCRHLQRIKLFVNRVCSCEMLERWVWWWWSAVLSAVPHCIDGLLWVSESSILPFSTSATVLQLFIFHDAVRGNTLLMADFPCKEKWWSLYLAAHFTLQNLFMILSSQSSALMATASP